MIRRPGAILALLTALNLLNYLDRLVLSAVLPKLRDELGLDNFVGGALATVFLIGYFATSPIFGRLADRGARKGLIALGIAIWCGGTVATGLSTGTTSLIVARVFVGVGEASYATLAPTIIDDLAPPEKKGRYLAIFYSAAPIGSALGYLLGGFIEHRYGWRTAFYVAGGPGIVLAASCLLIVEPARKLADAKQKFLESLKVLMKIPLYRQGVFGYCAYTFAVGGFAFWAPTFLYDRYGMKLDEANFTFGVVTVVSGALGTAIGGALGDRAAKRRLAALGAVTPTAAQTDDAVVRGNLWISGIASWLGAPLALACFLSPNPTVFFVCLFLCEMFLFLSSSPVNAVVLRSVPEALRASAMALSIFGIHLLGDLWSEPLVGLLADHVPIQWAMMPLPAAVALSGLLWTLKSRAAAPKVATP